MELLNSKVNHKDYMCDHTPWGVALVKMVGSERFKLLYDIYHMQIMEGDVISTIRASSASDQLSTYQASRRKRSSHGISSRPSTCAQPVMPGLTARRRRSPGS